MMVMLSARCGCGGGAEVLQNRGGEGDDGGTGFRLAGLANGATGRANDSDEDGDTQLEDLVDLKTCLALVVYLGVLILVLIIACVLIVMQRFYAGDVILCCIIALYELSVLQIVAVAVARRRSTLLGTAAAAAAAAAAREESSGAGGDLEAGTREREVAVDEAE